MEEIKRIAPIFIGKTASFWAGILPTALTTLDLMFQYLVGEGSGPVANAIAALFGIFGAEWTGEQIASFMQTLYPLYLIVFAQQRGMFSGKIPRPYTISPEKEKTVTTLIENGKEIFDAGVKIGELSKR